jgi:triosephosphate isomerase
MKKLIAGNWKMNTTGGSAGSLIWEVESKIQAVDGILDRCDFVVCPPFVYLDTVKGKCKKSSLGAQDCSDKASGAFTGDISAAMLKDIGATYVILGHSERRQYHKETDQLVHDKAVSANAAGLTTIICVGETEAEREAGKQNDVVAAQLATSVPSSGTAQNTVIAYEPVWAIGTGKTATAEDIRAMHAFIREKLTAALADGANIRILYGGSVKPSNAAEIFAVPHVDGALIGGASLKADDFMGIATAVKE